MEERTISYYVGRAFRRLDNQEASHLALASLKQLEQEGYRGVGYQAIYDALKTARAHPDSLRMQTGISKAPHIHLNQLPWNWRPKYAQTIFGPEGERVLMFPRRLVTTYETEYKPSNFTQGMQEWERLTFLEKVTGMDTRQIARFARENPQVKQISEEANKRGAKYGLLLTMTTESSTLTSDGRLLELEDGRIIPHIRRPKIIIPGTTDDERRVLDTFCDQYQIPNKKVVDRLLGITD